MFLLSKIINSLRTLISIDLPGGEFGGEFYPDWKKPIYESFANKNQKINLIRSDSHSKKTFEKVKSLLGNNKIDVYITIKNLEGLNLSGSGKVIGDSKFEVEDLDLSVSGSGDLELDVFAKNIDSGISGSGSIELSGVSGYHKVSISGSGKLAAEDMEVEEYKIHISGSGACRINVTKEIEASISGSGSVSYKGNPDRVHSSSSGSCKIRKMTQKCKIIDLRHKINYKKHLFKVMAASTGNFPNKKHNIFFNKLPIEEKKEI